MKKLIFILLALVLAASASAQDFSIKPYSNIINGLSHVQVSYKDSYPDNPLIEGENPFTGEKEVNPSKAHFMLVLDNSERAYPHWGVEYADIIFQAPNAGAGATKILALFSDNLPENAGPSRSGRMPFGQIALSFNAGLVSAGTPGASMTSYTDFTKLLAKFKLPFLSLLSNKSYAFNYELAPKFQNAKMREIADLFAQKDYAFRKQAFMFTDDKSIEGVSATKIAIRHLMDEKKGNPASEAYYLYDESTNSYKRINSSGVYSDRTSSKELVFKNIIVVRENINWYGGYQYYRDLKSGTAEFFINGQYVQGGWYKESENSRIVFVDANGDEIALQRGKSFIVFTAYETEVSYE